MSYRQKYYTMAFNELEKRRKNSQILRERHIAEAEANIPGLSELRRQLAASGAQIASVIFGGGDNVSAAINDISEKNIALQDKIAGLLVEHGYKADYLDECFFCPKCKDTGVYENERCSCFLNDVKRFECEELNASSPIQVSSFESFDIGFYPDEKDSVSGNSVRKMMLQNLEYCKKYADDFHLPCSGILMKGKTGLGKTHLSLAIAGVVINKGYSVVYGSVPDLLRKIEQQHFGADKENNTLELLENADLLILDDLGAEFESKFYTAALYNIINNRINAGKPTIVNTNCEISEIRQRYDDRIASRLLTMETLNFCGKDVRLLKKYAKC